MNKFYRLFVHEVRINWWFSNGFHMKSNTIVRKCFWFISNKWIIREELKDEQQGSAWHITSIERNGIKITPH